MIRLISAVALGLMIAVAAPVGAEAKTKSIACKAAGLDGKKMSWKCKAGQACCWNVLLNQGTCGAKGAACM